LFVNARGHVAATQTRHGLPWLWPPPLQLTTEPFYTPFHSYATYFYLHTALIFIFGKDLF